MVKNFLCYILNLPEVIWLRNIELQLFDNTEIACWDKEICLCNICCIVVVVLLTVTYLGSRNLLVGSLNSKCTQGKVLYYLMLISRQIFLEIIGQFLDSAISLC